MSFKNCNNYGNQVNENDNICKKCGNNIHHDIIPTNKRKKIYNILKIGIYIIIGFVLGVSPVLFNEFKSQDKPNQENHNIIDDSSNKEEINDIIEDKNNTNVKEDKTKEEIKQEHQSSTPQKPNTSNNKPKEESNNNTINNKENEEALNKKNIIGIWTEANKPGALVFTDKEILQIRTDLNKIDTFNYTIDRDNIILNQTKYIKYEIKDNSLYLNGSILKKQSETYKLPSIYYNNNVFYGTWKLESDTNMIVTEDGIERTLTDEMIVAKNNTSGYGSCGGSGCTAYIINFNNDNPELYTGKLCYELIDKNTLKQIKCHSDLMLGYDSWENETLHNITYKKIN